MQADAGPERIRAAYRERARQLHPDRGGTDSREMAALNEAYRVLSDPGRRALYDRSLRGPQPGTRAAPPARHIDDDVDDDFDDSWFDIDHLNRDDGMDAIRRSSPLSPAGPARMPWKLMLVSALVGTVVVLVAAAFNDPPSQEPPDGILRPGSCVEIEVNGDAREVTCTGDGDVVVEVLVPTSARCPTGTLGHRDRLGLGIACIRE